jgi:hypothetical protein
VSRAERVHEIALHAPIRNIDLEVIDEFEQFIALEEVEDLSFREHDR